LIAHFAIRLQKHVPESAAGDYQQGNAEQNNQNVLASFSGPVEGAWIRKNAVDPHRIGDVFDFAISERLISADQLVFYLLVNAARDINLARISDSLKTGSNINAITVNIISFDDNVAKIDTDPILDPMMLGQRRVASNHVLLDNNGAPHGFDWTIENGDKTVAGGFDEPSVVFCNAGLYEVALDPLDAIVRSFLIDLH